MIEIHRTLKGWGVVIHIEADTPTGSLDLLEDLVRKHYDKLDYEIFQISEDHEELRRSYFIKDKKGSLRAVVNTRNFGNKIAGKAYEEYANPLLKPLGMMPDEAKTLYSCYAYFNHVKDGQLDETCSRLSRDVFYKFNHPAFGKVAS